MPNQPIPVPKANAMIEAYFSYMEAHSVDMAKQTQSVSFTGPELLAWMNTVMPYSDELRIFMGEYLPNDEFAGRTTVILWPYKDGKPARRLGGGDPDDFFQPYNVGTLNP